MVYATCLSHRLRSTVVQAADAQRRHGPASYAQEEALQGPPREVIAVPDPGIAPRKHDFPSSLFARSRCLSRTWGVGLSPDTAERTNLNRLIGARPQDVRRAKADVAAELTVPLR